MHPALGYDLMQARQHDRLRSAAQRRLAAQAKAAHHPRRDRAPIAPRLRVLLRLRPA